MMGGRGAAGNRARESRRAEEPPRPELGQLVEAVAFDSQTIHKQLQVGQSTVSVCHEPRLRAALLCLQICLLNRSELRLLAALSETTHSTYTGCVRLKLDCNDYKRSAFSFSVLC